MFDNPTVFILGAGASWHYGYPTGEELVKKVIQKARLTREYFRTTLNDDAGGIVHRPNYITRNSPDPLPNGTTGMKTEWSNAVHECDDLIDRLTTVDPLVIDYFLGQNPHLRDIGRFLIASVLLECEAYFHRTQSNSNRQLNLPKIPDNWYRFLIHKLVTGCPDGDSLLNNKVTFITFNYDVSLEFQLFKGLSKLALFYPSDAVTQFFADSRFLHIYGKIRKDLLADPPAMDFAVLGGITGPQSQPGPPQLWIATKALFDMIYEASKTIRTIAPHEKTIDSTVNAARRVIAEASCIYILGYGFDPHNNRLLELYTHLALEKTHKTVMFTNFCNRNVINKNASRVFFWRRDKILSTMPDIIGGETDGYLCEKSLRNVYDALADDFDSPEEHLQSATPIASLDQ
jgi:hypothetical protein